MLPHWYAFILHSLDYILQGVPSDLWALLFYVPICVFLVWCLFVGVASQATLLCSVLLCSVKFFLRNIVILGGIGGVCWPQQFFPFGQWSPFLCLLCDAFSCFWNSQKNNCKSLNDNNLFTYKINFLLARLFYKVIFEGSICLYLSLKQQYKLPFPDIFHT